MTRLGMDVDVVDSVGKQLKQRGGSLQQVIQTVDGLINRADQDWWGRKGQQFVHEWRSVHRLALVQAAAAVTELSETALRNVTEQRSVSSAGGEEILPWSQIVDDIRATLKGAFDDLTWDGISGEPRSGGEWSRQRDLVDLAAATYGGPPPPGWARVTSSQMRELGLDPNDFQNGSGFGADLFINTNGEYVLAFRGTEPTTLDDLKTDVFGVTGVTDQDRSAIYLSTEVSRAIERRGGDLTLTGHSLGGRLATDGSIATGRSAVVFNSAGMSEASLHAAQTAQRHAGIESHPDQITHIHNSQDPLTNVQKGTPLPDAIGRDISVNDSRKPPSTLDNISTLFGSYTPIVPLAIPSLIKGGVDMSSNNADYLLYKHSCDSVRAGMDENGMN